MGKPKKKFSKAQIKKLKVFWKSQLETTNRYKENIYAIEKAMADSLGIDNLEFFWCDGSIVGIGDYPMSTYKLVQGNEIMGGKYDTNKEED